MFEPRAVSHLVTWQDGRCSSEFLASLPRPESHLSVASGFGCATIFWLLKNRYGQLFLNWILGFQGNESGQRAIPPAGQHHSTCWSVSQ